MEEEINVDVDVDCSRDSAGSLRAADFVNRSRRVPEAGDTLETEGATTPFFDAITKDRKCED